MAIARAPAGFTFIELVLVVTTIAIVGVIAMPKLGSSLARLEAEQASGEAAQLMRVAHAEAVAGAQRIDCRYDAQTRQFLLHPSKRHSRALPTGTEVELQTPDPAAGVVFYPNGTSSGGTVVLTMVGHAHHLSIDPITSLVTVRSGRPAAR